MNKTKNKIIYSIQIKKLILPKNLRSYNNTSNIMMR